MRESHGHWYTGVDGKRRCSREYRIWSLMKDRCFNQRSHAYGDYGGRGITVCERWRTSFLSFLADLGPSPSPEHSIDRIDNNGNYEPRNVRWATPAQQGANKRPYRRGWKLTRAQGVEIRRRALAGEMNVRLAVEFGVTKEYVSQIKNNRIWREL